MTRAPTDVDAHIGRAIRERRKQLGITFQQVQKYENGRNRVAASRLLEIARALDAPVVEFFADLGPSRDGSYADGYAGRDVMLVRAAVCNAGVA